MSNGERQRNFQAANPGYDARRKSRERASAKRGAALMKAQMQAEALAEQVQMAAETIQTPATQPLLMLPAPVVTVEIPGITTIDEIRANLAARSRV
jgi:aryl-alcohol dehydrogenase-like predicted oxidoreductase